MSFSVRRRTGKCTLIQAIAIGEPAPSSRVLRRGLR